MDTTDFFDHFFYNFKLLDVVLECCIDESSSHLRTNAILIDHLFYSKLVINKLCFQPSSKWRFLIILYHFLSMSLVWLSLISDVLELKQGFVHEYRVGNAIFNVSLTKNHMKTHDVTSELFESWNVHWKKSKEQFDEYLNQDEHLKCSIGKMSWIRDENHCLQA